VEELDGDATTSQLGRAVQAALMTSMSNVPHPSREEIQHLADELLRLAGVRSFRKFMEGARAIGVEQDGLEMRFIPYKNGGPRRGFEHMLIKTTVTGLLHEVGLGEAVLAALDQAE
jgi:hypothetical protein